MSVGDVATTMYGLSHGAHELNPLVRDIVKLPLLFLSIKTIGIIIIMTVIFSLKSMLEHGKYEMFAPYFILLTALFTISLVVFYNIYTIIYLL